MQPVTPIVPGMTLTEIVIAKNQPPYLPLIAHIMDDGTVLIRWKLTWRERLKLVLTGNLWHWVMAFGKPLQPIHLSVDAPEVESYGR